MSWYLTNHSSISCVPDLPMSSSYQRSFYIALAVSIFLLLLVVAMAAVLLKTHTALRQTVLTKMATLKERGAGSLRRVGSRRGAAKRGSFKARNVKGVLSFKSYLTCIISYK